jgi:radical SAM superfamily enzyme YgiQ (UPF0313 family)
MMNLAVWLKKNGFRADQVQTFYPSPMATATAMYHTGLNPLKGVHRDERGEKVDVVRAKSAAACTRPSCATTTRQLAAAARGAEGMGRADLIGNGKQHLIPTWQPPTKAPGARTQAWHRPSPSPSKAAC